MAALSPTKLPPSTGSIPGMFRQAGATPLGAAGNSAVSGTGAQLAGEPVAKGSLAAVCIGAGATDVDRCGCWKPALSRRHPGASPVGPAGTWFSASPRPDD